MKVVGMMSGTSLDGIDLVLCNFNGERGKWLYEIEKAATINYSSDWKKKLSTAPGLTAEELIILHNEYGTFIGNSVHEFLGIILKADIVASHGHTIFHQPGRHMTFQLGSGAYIAAGCKMPVVADFRTTDVALGGQGAPLVPIGDKLLFTEYDYCLNLGGFANISNDVNAIRIAFDICPVNIIANTLSGRIGLEYDQAGETGRSGALNQGLVDELNNLEFYKVTGPKSLGREWIENTFMPVVNSYKISVPDLLRSFYEHVAIQISSYINKSRKGKVLVTGGGAFNKFLVELIARESESGLIIPDDTVVKYKEAIIFAFLGMLRYENRINCLASVTGASRDSSAGAVYLI
jgi:anhydro-N-acetylmuramic acid kinase